MPVYFCCILQVSIVYICNLNYEYVKKSYQFLLQYFLKCWKTPYFLNFQETESQCSYDELLEDQVTLVDNKKNITNFSRKIFYNFPLRHFLLAEINFGVGSLSKKLAVPYSDLQREVRMYFSLNFYLFQSNFIKTALKFHQVLVTFITRMLKTFKG